jgi:hypothetical protein
LRAIDPALGKELRKVDAAVSKRVVDEATPDIPVRTGALKASARALGDTGVLGNAKLTYVEPVYWKARNRWYHREADRLEQSGELERIYTAGLEAMLRAAGLDDVESP